MSCALFFGLSIYGQNLNKTITKFAYDAKTINKVAQMTDVNSNFRKALGADWEKKLNDALKANKHLNCETCKGTFNRGPRMDNYLKDLEFVGLHFDPNTAIGKRIHQWSLRKYLNGSSIPLKHGHLSEAHQFLNFLRKKNIKETDIKNIDGAFFDDVATSKKYDIELKTGETLFFELKNKDFLNMLSLAKGDISQMFGSKGAFSKISAISQLNWVAYLNRFGKNASPSFAKNHLKKLWQKALQNTNPQKGLTQQEIFETIWNNTNLRNNLFGDIISSTDDINIAKSLSQNSYISSISDINTDLYKFIEVN